MSWRLKFTPFEDELHWEKTGIAVPTVSSFLLTESADPGSNYLLTELGFRIIL